MLDSRHTGKARIFITGVTGFVGRKLISHWFGRHDLVCLVRDPAHDLPTGIETIPGNLSDPYLYQRLPTPVDAVIHLAQGAGSFPQDGFDLFDVNTWATLHLADYAWRAGARRFVYASSGNVYGKNRSACRQK